MHSSEQDLGERRQEWVDLQRRHAVAGERANVLRDLERRKEGLGPGVKDLLTQAQDTPLGPLGTVRGMVADLVRVDVKMAPLIDVALGELTQYVVVQGGALAEALAAGSWQPQGRVGILDWSVPESPAESAPPNLHGRRAVIGRADEFVECDPPLRGLVEHLLSTTWCVETLADALRLQRESSSSGLRFVTRSGELVEAAGQLLAGPRKAPWDWSPAAANYARCNKKSCNLNRTWCRLSWRSPDSKHTSQRPNNTWMSTPAATNRPRRN